MKEYFAEKGGATAYLGACVPGFPNSFLLLGMLLNLYVVDKR
jgi:hypothetical protein